MERATGGVLTDGAAALLAAFSGNPLVALLPVLTNAIASGRQRARVERAIVDVSADLEARLESLRNITDEQYKLLNETILALFQTTDQRKLEYLRAAVRNELSMNDLIPQEAAALSRIVRDISAEEADFVIEHFSYHRIHLTSLDAPVKENVLVLRPASREGLVVSGLLALGILTPGEATFDDSGLLRFSEIVVKLILILRK